MPRQGTNTESLDRVMNNNIKELGKDDQNKTNASTKKEQ